MSVLWGVKWRIVSSGGTWRFIRRPAYRADGTPNGNCTLSEDCNLNLRISQPSRQGIYSNTHALGLIAAHGNSGKYLNSYWWAQYYSNVYLSRDAGESLECYLTSHIL